MASTPANSGTHATLAAEALHAPRQHKAPDCALGNDNFRRLEEDKMVRAKRWVQVTFSDFMNKLVPAPIHDPFDPKNHKYGINLKYLDPKAGDSRQEKRCYPTLCKFIERAYTGSRLVVKDVADWPDKSLNDEQDTRRVDLCSYLASMETHWTDPKFSPSEDCDKDRAPFAARNNFVHAICGLEVKLEHNGFKSTTHSETFLLKGDAAAKTRGQIMDYATEIQLRGHRTHVFMVFVYKTKARVMRFDRNGVVVSQEISLKALNQRQRLYEFFYHLGRLSDEQLGLDPTATMIPGDAKFLRTHDPDWKALEVALHDLKTKFGEDHLLFKAIDAAFGGDSWPLFKLCVPQEAEPGSSGATARRFLVRNLAVYSVSPTGRSTKGCIAFDPVTKRFVFVKDYWRPHATAIRADFEVYKRLSLYVSAGIATVLCAGDLTYDSNPAYQTTVTERFFSEKNKRHSLVHTRIVLNEVGLPLKVYEESMHLCVFLFDALKAHKDAYEKAGILHRDISEGNIVIYQNQDDPNERPMGLLIDWDLCRYKDELHQGPRQKDRSGTWRFMSGLLLQYPRKPNSVSDDLESFYHVLALFALRFHKHKQTGKPKNIKSILVEDYDKVSMQDGYWVGSDRKSDNIKLGKLPSPLTTRDRFSHLLKHLVGICKTHYEAQDEDDLDRRYGSNSVTSSDTVANSDNNNTPAIDSTAKPVKSFNLKPSAAVPVHKNPAGQVSAAQPPTLVVSPELANSASASAPLAVAGPSTPFLPLPNSAAIPSTAKSSQSTGPSQTSPVNSLAPTPPALPLDSHKAFYKAFLKAIEGADAQIEGEDGTEDDEFPWAEPEGLGWTEDDKTKDQFQEIDWSSRPEHSLVLGTKRTRDSAFPATDLSHLAASVSEYEGSDAEESSDDEPLAKRTRLSLRSDDA